MLRNCLRSSRLFLLFLVLLPASAASAESVLTLDPASTEISFDLPATGHDVHGFLFMTEGRIVFDEVTGAASGEIILDARKTDTQNPKRDKKMHEKVLESLDFPTITFRPDHIEGEISLQGASDFKLVGTLTLHGDDHPFTMDSHAEIRDGKVTATSSFPVPYLEWGLHNPSVLVLRVGRVVDVKLQTAGKLQPTAPTEATGTSR